MRKLIATLVVLLTLVAVVGYRMYNKPHRSIQDADSIPTDAVSLFNAFADGESEANQRYLGNVVEITGEVSEILVNQEGDSVLVLKTNDPLFGVSCTMADHAGAVHSGMDVTIKGLCTGYLSDVVITQAIRIR